MIITDKYINLITDFGFKYILGRPENKEFTISFVNSVLPDKDRVDDIEFLPTEHLGSEIEARIAIFDILCITKDGRRILIELQKLPQYYFADRTLFYSTWPIQQQAQKGDWNYKLDNVYVISVIDFVLKSTKDSYLNRHKIINLETHRPYTEALEFITIELPNFRLKTKEPETIIDLWIWHILNLHKIKKEPEEVRNELFQRLLKRAKLLRLSKKEFKDYEMSIYNERNMRPFTDYAHGEGFKEGIDHGIEQGINQSKTEMVKKMLSKQLPLDDISEISGLSKDQIFQIQADS